MSNEATRVMSDAEMDAAERLAEARLAEARTRPSDSDVEARVQEHLRRPYRMEVRGNPEEGYLATAPELPGCMTAGETPEEALRMLRDAMASWLETAIIAGNPIPEPGEERYSGRMLLRLPRSLHARLAEQAGRENVSINQLALTLIAEGLGREQSDLLADTERALDTTGIPPGPDREIRRFLRETIRTLAVGERWDPASDSPGSTHTALANAYLRLLGSLSPEQVKEFKRRVASFEGPAHVGVSSDELGHEIA